jgi:ATPase subunit of ABC transporter with duplicated ATPase domains
MSLTATLIAFATGLAAKVRLPAPDDRIAELERRCAHLERRLCDAENARDEAEVRLEAIYADNARARRYAEYEQLAQVNSQAQAMYSQAQAYNALQGLGLQQQGLGMQAQSLLGAQNLQMPAGWDCTCIPDRASALRRR